MKTFTLEVTFNGIRLYLDNLYNQTPWPFKDPTNFSTTNMKNAHRMTRKECNKFIADSVCYEGKPIPYSLKRVRIK